MLRGLLLRLGALGLIVACVAVALPVQSSLTRILILLGLGATVIGLFALAWRHQTIRYGLFLTAGASIVFLLWPSRNSPQSDIIENLYVSSLKRYNRVNYV